VKSITPDPLVARDDIPSVYKDGCHGDEKLSVVRACTYGDKNSPIDVVVVGDSHAAQWVPAMQQIATQRHWRLRSETKSGCPLIGVHIALKATLPYPSCTRWNADALKQLTGPDRPDLVITTSYTPYTIERAGRMLNPSQSQAAFTQGLRTTYRALAAAHVPVLVLQDTPRPPVDVPDCVSAHRDHLTACAFPRSAALGWSTAERTAAQGVAGVRLVNMNADICPTPRCAAVIGNVLVYRDNSHLTAHYVLTLAPALAGALPRTLPQPWPPRFP
jgi:hypothetical protein